MPIKIEKKTIGETEYEVTQLAFSAQRSTFVRLCNFAGPSVTGIVNELIKAAGKAKTKGAAVEAFTKALGDMDISNLGEVLGEFLAGLRDEDLVFFTEVFGKNSRMRPSGASGFLALNSDNRELQFAGDGFPEYFQWLAFCLEVNYRGFFSGGSGLQELARGLRRAGADK